MTDVEVAAPGIDALAQSLDEASGRFGDLDDVNKLVADDVLGYVRPPIRTGRLASTVQAEPDALGFTLVAGGSDAPYAPFVHARDPFLTDALNQRQAAVVDKYVAHAETIVDTIRGD